MHPTRLRAFLLCLLLAAVPAAVNGQTDTYVFGRGGISIGVNPDDLTDYWKTGFGGGASVGFGLTELLLVRGTVDYSLLALDENRLLEDAGGTGAGIDISGGSYSALAVTAELLVNYNSAANAAPYAVGGAGYYRGKVGDLSFDSVIGSVPISGESEGGFGLSGGAGLRVNTTPRVSFFAELGVLAGFLTDETHVVTTVNGGIAFRLLQ